MADERCWGECGGERPAETPQGLCKECLSKLGRPDSAQVGQNNIPTSATPPAGFVPPEPAELAGQFPQLEILELLGQGGMGAVYKARQKHLDRLVALKILPPQIGQSPAFADRFVREARSLARLNDQHIVSVFDFGHTDAGLYYFIMEFVDGTDLRRIIQAGEISTSETLAIISQVCDALQFAHDEGIVHRDVKPENILLNKKGQAKIADFGLAKLVGRPATGYTLTQAGQRMGTPHYMAPEQIEHPNEVDHRADIYSLGVVFYEMLTGELPLGRFATPSQKAAVDTRLDTVILRTLEKEPERRYQHVSEMKTDVETISAAGRVVVARDFIAGDDLEAARLRLSAPAAGLKISGLINCMVSVPLMLVWLILTLGGGLMSLQAIIVGGIGLIIGTMGLLTVVATQRMTRLQSFGLAITASLLQFIAIPGSLLGLWMGIWALIVLTREEVHEAFNKAKDQSPAVEDSTFWKRAVILAALMSSFIFLITLAAALADRQFLWFIFLYGPPMVVLDLFAVNQLIRHSAPGSESPWEQAKTELDRITGSRNTGAQPQDAHVPVETRRKAIGSFALGLFCVFLSSLRTHFAIKFIFVALPLFFTIFMGMRILKNTRTNQARRLDVMLAIGGIAAALIAFIALFAT
ncbi:serine/threonine-protein kinase [Planctomycetota bacterium]